MSAAEHTRPVRRLGDDEARMFIAPPAPGMWIEVGGLERFTIPDVAAALEVRPNTVSSYRSRGQMPAPTGYVGRTPWWSPADIEPWIEQQRANRRHVGRS